MEKNDITQNMHYQNGLFLGSKIIKFIENTTYKTLENALAAKSELRDLYKDKLNYTKKDKDYAEVLGIIKALETEIKLQDNESI